MSLFCELDHYMISLYLGNGSSDSQFLSGHACCFEQSLNLFSRMFNFHVKTIFNQLAL